MIGSRLGNWVLDREIGQGGAGIVYLAHADPVAVGKPSQAAVKVLAAELAADPGFLGRFQREIEVLAKLDHPNIVKLYGSGQQDGRYFFAMEYVEGRSFEQIRQDVARLPWRDVLELALQIAPALKHAHDRGVIHRDLKPANLLRGQDGIIKLTDFGIASLFAARHFTVAGAVVGTAEDLSPEQAAGRLVTPRSDLYSLGVVLYTLLTGKPPFQGDILDLLQKHRFAQFDRPIRLAPDIPGDLDTVVCQLMAKEPAQRPADAGVLAKQLTGLRRRLDLKGGSDTGGAETPRTVVMNPPGKPGTLGPATLMSELMRAELDEQNRGGPWRRFFNHPVVLIVSFALTVSLLTWALWPLSPDVMYQRGAALMESSDPDQWYEGWNNYLEPLQRKYPDNSHQAEIEAYRRRYDSYRAARIASRLANRAGPMTEAQWFYQLGLRQRQQGQEPAARRTWQSLIDAFKDVPSEQPWVALAQSAYYDTETEETKRELDPVREAVRRAKELRAQGKTEAADAILKALRELYGKDDAVRLLIEKD